MRGRLNTVASIDINPDRVCVCIGRLTGAGSFEVAGMGLESGEAVGENGVKDLDGLSGAIYASVKKAEAEAGLRIYKAGISVSGCAITAHRTRGMVCVGGRSREIRPGDVRRALEMARRTSIPFENEIIDVVPQVFIIDDQKNLKEPVGLFGRKLEAETTVISAPASFLQNLRRALSMAGIDADAFVYSGISSFCAVAGDREMSGGTLLQLDAGRCFSELSVFEDGRLRDFVVVARGGVRSFLPSGIIDGMRNWMMGCASADILLMGSESLRDGMIEHLEAVTGRPVKMAALKGIRGRSRYLNSPLCAASIGCVLYRLEKAGQGRRRPLEPVLRLGSVVRTMSGIIADYF